ncbi:hypothetical protein RJZ56_007174 [Blastomyces dermatitidis]|uniref:Uncharacterized protein n=1 Tax=Ajellomyces dermatitidis (strain ATCC 18188 / CBS 674.68) TaxID=653446 RepID=F2T571_AJEDA|nr:hypothetical protein BDDG_01233 [Blastomyces dermatitidis ATCC 18188]
MENSLTNLPPTTPPRYGAYSSSLNSSRENRTKENNRNGQDMDKDTKKGRKMSVLALLGKLSKSRDTNRSQSPFSPPPYSSSSTPPWHDSTTAPRLSNQLSPPTSTSLVSIHLKPAEYVRRIKRLLANSKRPPPSPLPQSSPHPPSPPGHVDGSNVQQNIPNNNGTKPGAETSLQQQQNTSPPPPQPILHFPTLPAHHADKIHNNNIYNTSTSEIPNPPQNPTRSSCPLLPPDIQPSLLLHNPVNKESRFLKTFLRNSPPRSSTPVTQFNIATLQAELDGRLGPMGGRGCVGVRDVSKPNPLGPDGGDDYDELLELGRSVRGTSRLEEEQERSRKKLVSGVERWLDGVEDGVPAEG